MTLQETAVPAAEIDITTFDPRDPQMRADPYPVYRALREQDPMHWIPAAKMWVATSYQDVMAICSDDETFHHRYEYREVLRSGEKVRDQPYFNSIRRMVFMMDGANHQRIRPLFAKWFYNPTKIRELGVVIQRIATELMDGLAERAEFDVVRDYAYQLPLRVIGELFGVPLADHAKIAHSIEAITPLAEGSVPKTAEVLAIGNGAVTHLTEYFRALVNERRQSLGDDLLSSMILAAEAGGFIDDEELIANVMLIYFAGHDTTTASTSLSVLALHRNPQQLEKLKADPKLMQRAVDELIRYEPPGQGIGRIPVKDVTVGNKHIESGTVILCYLAAANRDPLVFDDPDKLILDRPPRKILSFAAGAHTCLGNLLARKELAIALSTLFARRPKMRLETTDPPVAWFKPFPVSRGLRTLKAYG
jgi:cytochrome P450